MIKFVIGGFLDGMPALLKGCHRLSISLCRKIFRKPLFVGVIYAKNKLLSLSCTSNVQLFCEPLRRHAIKPTGVIYRAKCGSWTEG